MKREKQMGEAPAVLWREEKKTLTLCGEPVLEETLAWPEFEGKGRAVRRMTGYYRRLVRSCRLRWERETYCLACLRLAACREESRVFQPWQAGLTGEVAMEGADLLSIRMELREVRGDGRPLLSCSGVTWDWKAGAPVPLGMLLPERGRRRQLLEGIRQAGEGELRSGSCLLDPDWKETARRDFRASRFCLRPEGIELFYPQCSLAPAVEGVLSFRVPLAGAAWTAGEGTASET